MKRIERGRNEKIYFFINTHTDAEKCRNNLKKIKYFKKDKVEENDD